MEKMFDALNANRDAIKEDPDVAQKLVEDILLPHLDFISASKWVLGKYWKDAEKKQKIRFIKEFRTLLLRFYSNALAEFISNKDEDLDPSIMIFHHIKDLGDKKKITVRSNVTSKSGKSTQIQYHMHLTRKGWKVYDVSVDGVSVSTTYKTSFAS